MPRFGGEAQSAVLASFHNSWALQTDVFNGMPQSTAATVANGTFALHFYNRVLLDEFKGVRAMFAIFVFGFIVRSVVQALFFGSPLDRFGVDIVGRHGRHRRRRPRSGERAQCRGLQATGSSKSTSFREHLEYDKEGVSFMIRRVITITLTITIATQQPVGTLLSPPHDFGFVLISDRVD
jgi:hypothetical protein